MATYIDMMGNELVLQQPPQRIVSLVPSQTELLYDLGLDKEVVGITKFCIHPDTWFRTKTRIGGTKTVHLDKVAALKPDLIIANKEENDQQQVRALQSIAPTYISDITTLADAYTMIGDVGSLVGKEVKAAAIIAQIEAQWAAITKPASPLKVAYFIWRKPWMCAGADTFISHMIQQMGCTNALHDLSRYPEITLEQLKAYAPDVVFLSSEPYPFKAEHIAEIQAVVPNTAIKMVDGELFSWYGSRLLHTAPYLANLLQEVHTY